jgi:hypothetical protein
VRTYARLLGREEDGRLLQQTLDEERATDEQLTALAERTINVEAARAGGDVPEGGGSAARPAAKRGAKQAAGKRAATGAAKAAARGATKGAGRSATKRAATTRR